MFGIHPKTGKQIRIMQLETSIWKDRKIVTVGDTLQIGPSRLTPQTEALLLIEEADAAWLAQNKWRDVRMILASKKVLDTVGEARLKEMEISNMICLEEMGDLYPFLGGDWDGTADDAALIAAMLLRKTHICGLTTKPTRPHQDIIILDEQPKKPEIWMITQYYRPEKPVRAKEIRVCLQKNLACPLIDKMVLLTESDLSADFKGAEKVQQTIIGKRLTYADVLRWIYENAPPNVICVFANADIFLDESWAAIYETNLENKFLSILRYELESGEPKIFGPRPDSQDTWAVLSDSVKSRTWDWAALDFPFGKGGCDNAINVEMMRQKFLIANPALTLKTYHVHGSQIRTYDPRDIVDKPVYVYIQPTGLQDMNPLFSPPVQKKIQPQTFSRKIQGPTTLQAQTLCKMLERKTPTIKMETDAANLFSPPPLTIHKGENVFHTSTGLAYTYNSIYVGRAKASSEAWSTSQISGLSPSLQVETALVAPFPDEYADSPAVFILKYLSKIFLLRAEAGDHGDFWSPRGKPFIDALQMFRWNQREVPVIPRDTSVQIWSKKALVMLPTDSDLVTREQIGALRSMLLVRGLPDTNKWVETATSQRTVIFADEDICTREFLRLFPDAEVIYPGMTSLEVVMSKLVGASRVILAEAPELLWLLPKDALVIEIQNEMAPSMECLHIASAADLQHRMIITPKGPVTDTVRKMIQEKIAAFSVAPAQSTSSSLIKTLILPKNPTGFYAHSNDSFREMARLWEQRGYVKIIEDPYTVQCWLNGIGDTLLYDRPTHEWFERAPVEEKKFRVGLFGNPAPLQGGKSWSFWGRRPVLVEELAPQSIRPYSQRPQTLVFYGSIENSIQKKHRMALSWLGACSDSSMPLMKGGEYPLTHKEYLEKLLDARFGLCLAGYGLKCHREVECMAMGCVPICAAEVDMSFYAEPPVEGVHYFRASTPEEARRLSQETTDEAWSAMSAACISWWKRNASCDGFWELTCRLSAA